MDASRIMLITGGVKSGKSRFAIDCANSYSGVKTMIATAIPFDDQMRMKIAKHQQERGNDFRTIEEPVFLAKSIKNAQDSSAVILIDCTTMWLNNLYHRYSDSLEEIEDQMEKFIEALSQSVTNIVIVTNEIGLGVMPEKPLACRYADDLGQLNQRMAAVSHEVVMLISGIPQWIKSEDNYEQVDTTIKSH